jgi:hypothetical protein
MIRFYHVTTFLLGNGSDVFIPCVSRQSGVVRIENSRVNVPRFREEMGCPILVKEVEFTLAKSEYPSNAMGDMCEIEN